MKPSFSISYNALMAREVQIVDQFPADLIPCGFDALHHWHEANHAAVFSRFYIHAQKQKDQALREAKPSDARLKAAFEHALSLSQTLDQSLAREFFEKHFTPHQIKPYQGSGFMTGYFEPVFTGSLSQSNEFPVPVLAKPTEAQMGGKIPTRKEIMEGALSNKGLEVLWLRDWVELFIMQVQGSARIHTIDGKKLRLVYAGRNGYPYTSIGKLLIERQEMSLADMSLEALMHWLRRNEVKAIALMQENQSYVYFALDANLGEAAGPIGGAGISLTPHVSIAVDRNLWSYGLPFFLNEPLPQIGSTPDSAAVFDKNVTAQNQNSQNQYPLSRFLLAEDTGSAILGPARIDYFWGTGKEAGTPAGLTRHSINLVVLQPV